MPEDLVREGLARRIIEDWNSDQEIPLVVFRRREVNQILDCIRRGGQLQVRGMRGMGKTTALKVARNWLIESGIERERIAYFDLEDSRLSIRLDWNDLESLVDTSGVLKTRNTPCIFIDEIERLIDWEAWVMKLAASTGASMVVSSSISPTSSKDKHFTNSIGFWPISFPDMFYLSTDNKVDNYVEMKLDEYLLSGGMPFFIDGRRKQNTIRSLMSGILFSDILCRHQVRDTSVLYDMAVDLVSSPGVEVSATSLKGQHTRSIDQARSFLAYLGEGGLIYLVERIEDKGRKIEASRLCYPADTGLSSRLSAADLSLDKLGEVAVYQTIRRMGFSVGSFKNRDQLGLAVEAANGTPGLMIIVDRKYEANKRMDSIFRAMKIHGCERGLILGTNLQHEVMTEGEMIVVAQSLASWLLRPSIEIKSTCKKVDTATKEALPELDNSKADSRAPTVLPEQEKKLPSHLL